MACIRIFTTKKWISRVPQKLIEREDQSAAFVILQEIDDKTFARTILVQEVTPYHCDSCNEDFDTEASLIVHRTEQSILRTREALRQAEKKKHECGICGQTFSKKLQLINHRRIQCRQLLDTQKKQEWKETVREKNEELSAGPVKCDQCHKIFKKKKYLNVHKTLHGAPHICQMCGAKLTSEYYLKMHIRRHNKQFTEFCKICNKGFYLKAVLKYHMAMHIDEKPCICEICHKSFRNQVNLRNHMKIHAETRKKFKCDICSFETFYNCYYKEHMWIHTGENSVTCEVCGKLIRRQYMKTHIRIHTGEKPEICEFCGKAFSARKYLVKHRRIHTGEKPYKCKICEKRFTQRGTLTAHLRRHENPKWCDEIDIEDIKLDPIDELQGIELVRYQDEVPIAEEYHHIGHQEIVMETIEYKPEDSNDKPESASEICILKQVSEHDSNRKRATVYECEICGKQMLKKLQFLKHRQDHERNPKTEDHCEECDKVFDNHEKLQKHKIKAHQKEKPFQCVICGKCFKTEEFLKTHLKQHNKRFTCDICGVSKVSGYDLRLHKKKHNQEYVIHCETCNKGFYTNQTLERHLLTHTGEKPFVCKICNTPYASAAALKVHLKIHTGENQITCEVCGKSVSSKTYLQIHMRIHSGEKPHVCEVCGKAFSVRKYLIVHLRTHTGEKPYECKVCQKRFTQQGSLNSHMKSHNESK
ncbi:PREDICTED: zinc finger protein 260-like [Atta cephalotes]|uniref:C2H2-type domain-containing protein n=1 Tax=Atta cephalotes TaxID=12957 RepID=A0A158NRK2_ATTCE|nr:PREDICTED: zinc finger protein 260-like [Atta cephalotes]